MNFKSTFLEFPGRNVSAHVGIAHQIAKIIAVNARFFAAMLDQRLKAGRAAPFLVTLYNSWLSVSFGIMLTYVRFLRH